MPQTSNRLREYFGVTKPTISKIISELCELNIVSSTLEKNNEMLFIDLMNMF